MTLASFSPWGPSRAPSAISITTIGTISLASQRLARAAISGENAAIMTTTRNEPGSALMPAPSRVPSGPSRR